MWSVSQRLVTNSVSGASCRESAGRSNSANPRGTRVEPEGSVPNDNAPTVVYCSRSAAGLRNFRMRHDGKKSLNKCNRVNRRNPRKAKSCLSLRASAPNFAEPWLRPPHSSIKLFLLEIFFALSQSSMKFFFFPDSAAVHSSSPPLCEKGPSYEKFNMTSGFTFRHVVSAEEDTG